MGLNLIQSSGVAHAPTSCCDAEARLDAGLAGVVAILMLSVDPLSRLSLSPRYVAQEHNNQEGLADCPSDEVPYLACSKMRSTAVY